MPPVVGAVTTFIASALTAGFTQSVGATLWGFAQRALISVGLGLASSALTPKPKSPSFNDPGRPLAFQPNPDAPRQVIYGETAIAGQIIAQRTSSNNKYAHFIAALGDGGPYESVEAIRLNNETVTLDGSGYVTAPTKWASSKCRIETKLGTESQTAFSSAVSEISDWTSDHAGKGVALAHLRYEYDPEVWTSGIPSPLFIMRGRKVYDPRLDSSPGNDPTNASYIAWSQNPALWALDYIRGVETNGTRILGLGVPSALIDWQSFADAADVCDETVAVKAGGTIARYTGGGGIVSAADDPIAVLEAMMSAMAGVLTTRSGLISVYAGEAQTATVTLTDDDLAGPIRVTGARSIRETANAVSVQYREPSAGYNFAGAPAYRNSTWETEDDSEVLWTELRLPFTDDHRVAQRLAKIHGGNKREPREISARYKIKAIQIQEGEVFTLDSDSYGSAANGKYRVVSRKINPDGSVDITARSETDSKYDWTAASEEQDPPAGTVAAASTPTTATPTGWSVTATEVSGPQGAVQTVLNIAAPGSIDASVLSVEIEYQRQAGASLGLDFLGSQFAVESGSVAGDSDYIPVATLSRAQALNGYRIPNVERARGYSIRIRYRSSFYIASDWLTIEAAVDQGGAALAAPSGWTAAGSTQTSAEGYARPVVTVTAPTSGVPASASLVAIDIRKVTDAEFSDQTVLSRGEAARGRTIQAIAGNSYYVRVRYGSDGGVWGQAQIIPVSVDATGAVALTTFAVSSTSQTSGSFALPGFSASWDALSGDDLQRTRSIAVQYRLNGTTNVTTLYVEADETAKAVAGLIGGATYNVRARAEDVYGGGSWTSWSDVTVSSTWTVGGATSVGWSGVADDNGGRPEPNATVGATWGDNVAGRPTELTDGRIGTALDSSGLLQTAIPTAVANSSNLLRYTGGGTFAGALNANYITNTNELTDGASLGTTAAWASISSRPSELTDGRITTALDASGILQTNVPNASQVPTLTLAKISDAGALAAKATIDSASLLDDGVVETAKLADNSINDAKVAANRSFIQEGAGVPTATARRIYNDTTNDVIWYDDGTNIRRISREAIQDNLGSDTGFSGAAYKVVVAVELPGLKELDLLSIQTLQSSFQGPDEATAAAVVGEWAIGIVDASRSPGDAWLGTGTENIIADGRTITFQLDGSDVVVNGNGIDGLILDVGGYRVPVAYEGTAYFCLLLKLTASTSDQILLAGTGTQMRVLISP